MKLRFDQKKKKTGFPQHTAGFPCPSGSRNLPETLKPKYSDTNFVAFRKHFSIAACLLI